MLFSPDPILIELGPLTIYWYGFFMALALLAGLLVTIRVARWYGIAKETVIDLFFYLVIAGFVGARLFYILYNLPYFAAHPFAVLKIWEGGIAIHGALVAGAITVWWFAWKLKSLSLRAQRSGAKQSREVNNDGIASSSQAPPRNDMQNSFWLLLSIIAPGLALGQAIGRWGNFFNQELFGLPTNLPWGIPIDELHRPQAFMPFTHFHPTFLYESAGNLLIFAILMYLHHSAVKNSQPSTVKSQKFIVLMYVLLYSLLRFATETLRLDDVAVIGGVRVTMWLAIAGIGAAGVVLWWIKEHKLGD